MVDEQPDVETAIQALNIAAGDLAQGAYEVTRAIAAAKSKDRPIIAIASLDRCEELVESANEMMSAARKIIGQLDTLHLVNAKKDESPVPPGTIIKPFDCSYFGVGTAGFKNLCSYCNKTPTHMGRIRSGKHFRMVSLCKDHVAKVRNSVFG